MRFPIPASQPGDDVGSRIRAACVACATIFLFAAGLPVAQGGDKPVDAFPDSSLPPVGRSLFDFLVTKSERGRKLQRVPFPFPALLRHIGEQVEGGEESGIRAVLIPLGRSLQRSAAVDEYFRYPRVVAAVVGEPAAAKASAGMLLKDRLYLGYNEKAGVLEVISYNEAAGRFEFQVVKDYREGAEPRVLYGNRRMCLSCHQNQAPIFSRPPWDETNANPAMQQLLRAQKRDYYGVAVNLGSDAPNAIDIATHRANMLEAVQRLWREGCEAPSRPEGSVRCRAEAFAAALKYRLSGDRQIDSQAPAYREDFLPVLTESWRMRWPAGIAVPSPDVPNRDPFAALPESQRAIPGRALLRKAADITPVFDPLAPREPIDLRFGTRREDIELFVRNLAEFITEAEIADLDRWLNEKHKRAQAKAHVARVPCRVIERVRGMRPTQMQFACVAPPGVIPDIAFSGRLERQGARLVGGAFDRFTPSRSAVRDIDVMPAAIARTPYGSEVRLALASGGLQLRLADGNAVARVTLRRSELQRTSAGALMAGEADVWVLNDFAPLAHAIGELIEESRSGRSDVFSAQPFRRAAVVKALFAKLGMPARAWCCIDAAGMPVPTVVEDHRRGNTTASLAPFYRACATCHESRERFPPGFLYGGASKAVRNIDACAERMLYRLEMWSLPADARPKTHMPPAPGPHAARFVPASELGEMREYLKQRILDTTGSPANESSLVSGRYEELARCAPVFD